MKIVCAMEPHSLKAKKTSADGGASVSRLPEYLCGGVCVLVLFVFFQFFYRYHLCHREQFSLFIYAAEPLHAYLQHPAPLACLAGDFLTQFFSLTVVGPLLMALALTTVGMLMCQLLHPYIGHWSLLPAVAAVIMETGRQCGLTYPLSSTLQWVGILATLLVCRRVVRRLWQRCHGGAVLVGVLCLGAGMTLCGWGDWEKRAVNHPEFGIEQMFAVDNDWYRGNLDRMERRLARCDEKRNRFFTYYKNLLMASEYRMGEDLMQVTQPFTMGLYLPVTSSTSYPVVYMSNEVWYMTGDMTNAEHSALLGMIFSPKSTGSRPLKRLAEISLVNGDEQAAMKYLRILDKTWLYHRWARARMTGMRVKSVERRLDMQRTLLATSDKVRTPMDPSASFRHLLEDNPDNVFARDYLLSYDLLCKDVDMFKADYDRFVSHHQIPQRVWAEALLVWLAAHGASEDDVYAYNIPEQVIGEFMSYNHIYQNADGNQFPLLQQKFGHTYWFFYHFASRNNDREKQ